MKIRDKILIRKDLENGDFHSIISRVDLLLEEEENSYILFLKAKALYNLEHYNESLQNIKKALSYKDADKELLLLAGRIYFHLHYYDKAREFYLHALSKKPEYVEAMAAFAFLLYITGQFEKSDTMIEKAELIDQHNIFVFITRAKIALYEAGRKKESRCMEKVLTHVSGERYKVICQGLMALFTGKRGESRKLFATARSLDTHNQDLYSTLLRLTRVSLHKKAEKKKLRSFNRMILFFLFNVAVLALLFFTQLYGALLLWAGVLALYALVTIIRSIISMLSQG